MNEAASRRLRLIERGALATAVLTALLGLGTSGGCGVLPAGNPSAAWLVHLAVGALAAGAGVVAALRHRDIERARWRAAHDPHATKGEREYAHREAESQRRFSATVLLLAPLGVGYWMAYVFDSPGALSASDFLLVTPTAAFFAGLLWGRRRWPAEPPGESA